MKAEDFGAIILGTEWKSRKWMLTLDFDGASWLARCRDLQGTWAEELPRGSSARRRLSRGSRGLRSFLNFHLGIE